VRVLTVNTGSSTVKLGVVENEDTLVLHEELSLDDPARTRAVLSEMFRRGSPITAVGHRVVHGGNEFTSPLLLDAQAEERLGRLGELAPLHNPPALALIAVALEERPDLPQVACFDTAFHATLPAEAFTYALPDGWAARWGLRRYGFHGLSHSWASRRAGALIDQPVSSLRLVTAHLGAGASLAAVLGGRSVDTTMGFTPLDGLVMATRSGSVDPGLILWVLRNGGLTATQVEDALEHDAGLLGLSGRSGDLREVLCAADNGEERSALAYRVLLHRLRAAVAAMAAALGGIDGLVFTGGAGEGSARLRRDTCTALGFLGIDPPGRSNEEGTGDRVLSPPDASVATVVVGAREDLEIARQVRILLRGPEHSAVLPRRGPPPLP
jgi:acetate kinase